MAHERAAPNGETATAAPPHDPAGAGAGGVDARRLRDALGRYATGVAIVTARAGDGRPVGMTVNSFAAVSLAPPLVLWSAQRGVPPYDAFAVADHYAVHVLHAGQQALSDRFATPGIDRFAGLAPLDGLAGLPLLADYAARFQCAVEHRYDGGDHLILVGRVLAVDARPGEPLVYHAGRYHRL
ncbi:flavin reductase family protein [Rehaibacterium terrae]|jgi:3-hydroxy-9,10-secoandrosta-1,3,5(10)-triene-9,17-dione monooxygenase reductase component|uniref:Flavin reductase (DIM6/NTAB) family NADH-FMN oxidoreductase RutF n=1 Tax=Rehaibacterium terrae TaxID=1341696 RepID=A0A7W8DFA6_9GAMM|nr:flavin reductase family protein [Rehaibacterium terrae]MBB5016231.1 flavin reductase (DIM6/NTAB) family NADH-FMN oxidoreductase RutF [Rehaibacterium terrae]